jgi:hypothetical protein
MITDNPFNGRMKVGKHSKFSRYHPYCFDNNHIGFKASYFSINAVVIYYFYESRFDINIRKHVTDKGSRIKETGGIARRIAVIAPGDITFFKNKENSHDNSI